VGRCHHINGAKDHACGADPCGPGDDALRAPVPIGEGECAGGVSPFRPGDHPQEQALFDCWAKESTDIASIPIDYFPLDKSRPAAALALDQNAAHRDPAALYGEPHFPPQNRGPYQLRGIVKVDSKSWDSLDEGSKLEFRMGVEIARAEFERVGLDAPREGDLFRFWTLPFYTKWGQPFRESPPRGGFYFETINVEGTGYPFGGPQFVMFKISLRRDTMYAPERKLTGDVAPAVADTRWEL
jgi:hypothetical protein